MLGLHSILLFAFLATGVQMMRNISPSASIHSTARIGEFTTIGDNADLGENVNVGQFSTIGRDTVLIRNSHVGSFSTVGPSVTVDESARVGDYTNISPGTEIGSGSRIRDYVSIGQNVKIQPQSRIESFAGMGPDCRVEENVLISEYAKFANGNIVKKDSIVSSYVIADARVLMDERCYVGNYTRIGANSKVGKDAVLHEYVIIYDNEQIPDGQVVVAAPNSQTLFNVARYGRCNFKEIENMVDGSDSDFNQKAKTWTDKLFNKLTEQCPPGGEPRNNRIDFEDFPCLISFYLMRFYGIERFHKIYSESSSSATQNELQQEIHFGRRPSKQILSPENQKEFIKLLAVDRDIQRPLRVRGDKVCDMLNKIKNNDRPVRTADPKYAPS